MRSEEKLWLLFEPMGAALNCTIPWYFFWSRSQQPYLRLSIPLYKVIFYHIVLIHMFNLPRWRNWGQVVGLPRSGLSWFFCRETRYFLWIFWRFGTHLKQCLMEFPRVVQMLYFSDHLAFRFLVVAHSKFLSLHRPDDRCCPMKRIPLQQL